MKGWPGERKRGPFEKVGIRVFRHELRDKNGNGKLQSCNLGRTKQCQTVVGNSFRWQCPCFTLEPSPFPYLWVFGIGIKMNVTDEHLKQEAYCYSTPTIIPPSTWARWLYFKKLTISSINKHHCCSWTEHKYRSVYSFEEQVSAKSWCNWVIAFCKDFRAGSRLLEFCWIEEPWTLQISYKKEIRISNKLNNLNATSKCKTKDF